MTLCAHSEIWVKYFIIAMSVETVKGISISFNYVNWETESCLYYHTKKHKSYKNKSLLLIINKSGDKIEMYRNYTQIYWEIYGLSIEIYHGLNWWENNNSPKLVLYFT